MAMNFNDPNRNRGRKKKYISEINVTPMVDVMLVLLIIFMITSPMLVGGIEVDLPTTKSPAISGQYKPLVVSLDKQGRIFLFETEIRKGDLIAKLKEITKQKKDSRIFVKGDKDVSYGLVAEIMALIQSSGYNKVALISDIMQ